VNTLYCGHCLDVLRKHVKDESVDLIYIDPPFNTKRDDNYSSREWRKQLWQTCTQ
jgi:site-specific DNA-methyltransferase (adenine-specific)